MEEKACAVQQAVEELCAVIKIGSEVFAGTVYTARTKCGRPTCRCMKSEYRHENLCLSFKEDGASRTRTIPPAAAGVAEQMTADYRQLRKLRKDVQRFSNELLKEVDRSIEAAGRRGSGRLLPMMKKGGVK